MGWLIAGLLIGGLCVVFRAQIKVKIIEVWGKVKGKVS
jgi:hypothetical protein